MAQMNLDLSGVVASTGKTVLPTGIYNTMISSAEVKETSTKGWMIVVGLSVLDGEHEGKVMTERLNVVNANEMAQKIGLSTLKTMLTVGGAANPNVLGDSDDLVGLKMSVSVEAIDTTFKNDKDEEIETQDQKFLGFFKLQAAKAVVVPAASVVSAPTTPAPVVAVAPVAAVAPVVAAPVAVVAPAPVAAIPVAATPAAAGGFPWTK